MQKEQQIYLNQRLATLEEHERRKLYKRASLLRKVSQTKRKPQEDEYVRKGKSIDEFLLQLLREEDQAIQIGAVTGHGQVIWLGPKTCLVSTTKGSITCQLNRRATVAVGDLVNFADEADGHVIASVQPRMTVLSRPDVGNSRLERIIAANVDTIVVVVSVIAPPLHPNIIDRYMVAIQRGGAKMVLAVNKVDLLNDLNRDGELNKLLPYKTSVPIIQCSTESGTGILELREVLNGQVCAFVGHSGVGKSSLINAFEPDLNLETGSVSEGYGRGTHTTTSSTMHMLKGGTKLIDTPGIRSFGLWDVGPEELAWYFPEFDTFKNQCKFRDCAHIHEPNCGVKIAVERGELTQTRYQSYLRILTSL